MRLLWFHARTHTRTHAHKQVERFAMGALGMVAPVRMRSHFCFLFVFIFSCRARVMRAMVMRASLRLSLFLFIIIIFFFDVFYFYIFFVFILFSPFFFRMKTTVGKTSITRTSVSARPTTTEFIWFFILMVVALLAVSSYTKMARSSLGIRIGSRKKCALGCVESLFESVVILTRPNIFKSKPLPMMLENLHSAMQMIIMYPRSTPYFFLNFVLLLFSK